ncbi:MAG: ATP-dependent zinc metalloprotease FtsH 4 [Candidatus Omnitrophica bacterium]|nr:ATP-dependent zinc metalloprotease FtsH 4 [Candidatus Omnitrophota bacterium]
MNLLKKLKLFWWNHWIKIVVIGWTVFIFWVPVAALSSIDSYQRSYMVAWLSTMGLQATISAVIFVVLYSWVLQGGLQKLKKKQVKTDRVNIKWDDIVGMEAAKMEAKELVSLIKDRARVKKIGGNIIRGMLMMGPPGCGKTYMAKAIATEAGVPFISMSGAEFVEVFVGVGASRVRQLFQRARRLAYADGGCVIFIDEIDAVARKRVFSAFGGTEETNSTQNQLLAEMDGLGDKEENVIVIGATNAAEDSLDAALLRPGRFDRKIYVEKPDLAERELLFSYYLKRVNADASVDVARFARKAIGKSPADIANITKEAALIATRKNVDKVNSEHLYEAMERIDLGLKKMTKVSEKDRQVTAYHETGHLMALYLLHPTDDVFKASIIPRGPAGGVVYHLPSEETQHVNRDRVLANIKVALAGYAGEKVKFGVTATGVCNDFTQAMWWAHKMVWEWGMSKSGWVGDYARIPKEQLSEDIKQKLNMESHQIIQECMREVEELLRKESVIFERFAKELLTRNELDYDDIEAIFKEYGKANPRINAKYVPPQGS